VGLNTHQLPQTEHPARLRDGAIAPRVRLTLLRSFELRCGGEFVTLPMSARRLLAFLALHDRPLQRAFVAGVLWPDTTEERAAGNLRSALWRLRSPGLVLATSVGDYLRLAPDVGVDIRDASAAARSLVSWPRLAGSLEVSVEMFTRDLLPDWYDEWVGVDREVFRQLRLHALEALCLRRLTQGRYAEAVEAGQAAVAGEPLRESAHRVLIQAHLAEHNVSEAVRHYRRFGELLRRELGTGPSRQLQDLMQGVPR
jgi:DNA-binding SARP family transcriptional activator